MSVYRKETINASKYVDGRPAASLRLAVDDHGVVLPYATGPDQCDYLGARDMWVFEAEGEYHLFYDGCGPEGWRCCHAVSGNLVDWKTRGPILDLGAPGRPDSAYAGYGATFHEHGVWHFFYVGCRQTSPAPARVPAMPYLNLKAESASPYGPWQKRYDLTPFEAKPGTYYADTCNPGHIAKVGAAYIMFFSAAAFVDGKVKRTLGLARTRDLDEQWQPDEHPIVPLDEQIENAAVHYDEESRTWFVFTNHVGIGQEGEYRDAVWVYWTQDLNAWDPANKAVVVDGKNCSWSKRSIGMAAVARVGDRLGVIYDAPGGESIDNMRNSIALAWVDLPLRPPDHLK
jgi:predicted GH43/DUF377 family glycosyl hydrolase